MSNAKNRHPFERVMGLLVSTSCSCEQAQDPQYAVERNILKMHGFNVVDLFPPQAEVEKSRAITVEELKQAARRSRDWPRLEWDGQHYNEDQYDLIPADEHGEMPPIYKLRENAVSVEAAAEQNAVQTLPVPVPNPNPDGSFDKQVDDGRMDAERKMLPALPTIDELKAAAESVMPKHAPMSPDGRDQSEEELERYYRTRQKAIAVFYELMRGAGLMPQSMDPATASNSTPPQNNAGLYQGRIAEIDPVRWNTIPTNPLRDQYKDHNMTNLTYPSLSDEEEVLDVEVEDVPEELAALEDEQAQQGAEYPAVLEGEDQEHEEEEIGAVDGGNTSYGDPSAPTQIVIAIQDNEAEPERIRFYDNDGEMVVEAAAQKGKSFHVTPSSWWRSMSPERRRAYLEKHPNSRYAKAFRAKQERKKKKAAKKIRMSKKDSKAATAVDKEAADSAQAIKDTGVTLTDTIPEELDNEQDEHLDKLENEMAAAASEPEDEDERHPDDVSEEKPEELHVDDKAAKALLDHSKRDGFFKPVVSAVKKRVSHGTLGAMGRMMKGTMREGDKEKAIKGLTVALAAITVVGVGAGLAAIAGPGLMMKYVTGFVDAYDQFSGGRGSDDDGFDFSSESSSGPSSDEQYDIQEDKKTSDEGDMISDKGIADLSSMFLRWLDYKAQTTEDQDEEQ